MSEIHIVRSHQLGREAARTEVERIAQRVQEEHGASYEWDGDILRFKRSGVSGRIEVQPDSIDLKIKLGLLLSAIKGQLEERLITKVDAALAKYETGGAAPDDSAPPGNDAEPTA
jgi:putative polyhydroxyalkanoate system protein